MAQDIVVEDPAVWEPEIQAMEALDSRRPPAPGAVVFVGSSTIRMWTTLEADMAPLPVVNRGFGGAQADAVLHYAPRIVVPCRPRAVVLGAGENDLEPLRGKSPARVLSDVRALWTLLQRCEGLQRFYVLAIKRSPARRASWAAADECNRLLDDFARADARVAFVDVATPMLTGQGEPDASLFLEDGLHLSVAGYARWTEALRPRLHADLGADRRGDGQPSPLC